MVSARCIRGWPRAFQREWMQGTVTNGAVFLAYVAGGVAGTFSLSGSDPLWTDDHRAGYLHRFAVGRHVAGLGPLLLDRAEHAVRARR